MLVTSISFPSPPQVSHTAPPFLTPHNASLQCSGLEHVFILSSRISGSFQEHAGGTTGRVMGQRGEAGVTSTEGEQVGQAGLGCSDEAEQRPDGLFPLPVCLGEWQGGG